MQGRNDQYANLLGCPPDQSHLECFRAQTPQALVEAATALNEDRTANGGLGWAERAGFVPAIDGVTLTDNISNLYEAGKFAKVPLIVVSAPSPRRHRRLTRLAGSYD